MNRDTVKYRWSFYLALMFGTCIGTQGFTMLPFIMGASLDTFGLTEGQSGNMATIQLGLESIAILSFSSIANRLNKLHFMVLGFTLSVTGNLLAIHAADIQSVAMLYVGRGIAGFGEGLALACVGAIAALSANPIRTFAVVNSSIAVFATLMFFITPYFITGYGAKGIFGTMLAVSVLAIVASRGLAGSTLATANRSEEGQKEASGSFSMNVWVGLLLFGLFSCVIGGVWAFTQLVGQNGVGLSLERIGSVIAVCSMLMILGPLLANLVGDKFGWRVPIFGAVLIYAGVAFIFSLVKVEWLYALGILMHTIMAGFSMTIISGFFAYLEPTGRAAAAAPAFNFVGNAFGPAVMAAAVPWMSGYQALGWISAAILSFVLIGFYFVIAFNNRSVVKPAMAE